VTSKTAFAQLREMLRVRANGQGESVDHQIHERFGRECAVMITDMEGFSRRTRDRGIIDVLQLISRMTDLCEPVIEEHGGKLVKVVGDDLIAVFDRPESALRAAFGMREVCAEDRVGRHPNDQILMAAGIGWGYILDLNGVEIFGDEVNRASKLGEDLAEKGEILVTRAAREQLLESDWFFEKRVTALSGMVFEHFCVHSHEST